jgi:D-alanyl-D-alanine carboxypeptidase
MQDAAQSDSVVLLPISGYRSLARQAEIIRSKRDVGQSLESILRVNTAPGYSEHHTGRALDIGTIDSVLLEESFGATPAFAWLSMHAQKFGFRLSYPRGNPLGIAYEPWHWLWR